MGTESYITFFIAMLAIMNPIGNIAIFVSLLADRTDAEQKAQARQAAISIAVVLILITWAGNNILAFFGITSEAFESAGALIIMLLGLSMMKGHDDSKSGHSDIHYSKEEHQLALKRESIAVVPMCIPIVAGPGAITTIIVHSHTFSSMLQKGVLSLICLLLALILFTCFYFSGKIKGWVGDSGMKITTRIMGLVLTAIAFQMLGNGLKGMFPAWA